MPDTTPCIRCGKMRIVAKNWSEYIGTSLVTYTTTVCPDRECQKVVEEEFKRKKDHIDAIQANSARRKKENRRNKKTDKK